MCDYGRLDLARPENRIGERLFVPRQKLLEVRVQPVDEQWVPDAPVLDDLREPGRELALRQGRQGADVGNHRARLVKSADEILPPAVINSGLAADRGIHLREQGGGELRIS